MMIYPTQDQLDRIDSLIRQCRAAQAGRDLEEFELRMGLLTELRAEVRRMRAAAGTTGTS